jgi:hypothetical protein
MDDTCTIFLHEQMKNYYYYCYNGYHGGGVVLPVLPKMSASISVAVMGPDLRAASFLSLSLSLSFSLSIAAAAAAAAAAVVRSMKAWGKNSKGERTKDKEPFVTPIRPLVPSACFVFADARPRLRYGYRTFAAAFGSRASFFFP